MPTTESVVVAGAFAHQMSNLLEVRGFQTKVREQMQHEEAALYAMRGLQ